MQQLCYEVSPQQQGRKLGYFLREQGITAGTIKAVKYRGGGFFADGVPVHTDYVVHAGEHVTFSLPPEKSTVVQPQEIPLEILYEDAYAAVVDKPAGLAVHPTLNYPDSTLANGWVFRMRQRGEGEVFRPVNRLDKNTSGLVLCAKSAFAAAALSGCAEKEYLALAQGTLPAEEGRIDAPIARRSDSIIGRCVSPDGKPSVTLYRVLASDGRLSLVACRLLTGRTHQIRVHLSWLGNPLAGDTLYGGSDREIARHALHCVSMRFSQPVTGQTVLVHSSMPQDMLLCCEHHFGPIDQLLDQ